MRTATVLVRLDADPDRRSPERLTEVLGDADPDVEVLVLLGPDEPAPDEPAPDESALDAPAAGTSGLRQIRTAFRDDRAWYDAADAATGRYLLLADGHHRLDLRAVATLARAGAAGDADVVTTTGPNPDPTAARAALLSNDISTVLLRTEFVRSTRTAGMTRTEETARPDETTGPGGAGVPLLPGRQLLAVVVTAEPVVVATRGPSAFGAALADGTDGDRAVRALTRQPERYADELAGVLVAIEERTEPGPVRARLTAAVLHHDLLQPLAGSDLGGLPVEVAYRVVAAARDLLSAIPGPLPSLPAEWTRLAAAVSTGSPEEIGDVASGLGQTRPTVWLTLLRTRTGGAVEIGHTVSLRPDSAAPPDQLHVEVVLRHRRTGQEWLLPGHVVQAPIQTDAAELTVSRDAVLDPSDAAGMRPGIWDFFVRVGYAGAVRDVRLGSRRLEPVDGLAEPPIVVASDGRLNQLYYTGYGNLSLTIGAAERWAQSAVRAGRLQITDDGLRFRSAVHWIRTPPDLWLRLRPAAGGSDVRWRLRAAADGTGWTGRPGRSRLRLSAGTYAASIRPVTPATAPPVLADAIELTTGLTMDRSGRWRWARVAAQQLLQRPLARRRQRHGRRPGR